MSKKTVLVYFIMVTTHMMIFAQNSYYYATDGTSASGINLIEGSDKENSRSCQVKEKDKFTLYTPYDIKEYGFKNGRVYISKEIQLKDSSRKVFLERLCKGKATLYYYKEKQFKLLFFIAKDSTYIEIPKRNKEGLGYTAQLMKITYDCSNLSEATKLVSYNKKSLTRLITNYNDCIIKPFSHFRYGLYIGYELVKLIPSSGSDNTNQFNFIYNGGPLVGLFIDNPMRASYFSLHTELIFSKHGYSYNSKVDNKEIDFVANTSSIKIPVLIRYTYPSMKMRPFLNAGGLVSFNVKNESSVYESIINQHTIEIEILNLSVISDRQLGFSVGGGAEYAINYRNSLFLEIRYNKLYGFLNSESLRNSEISLVTGFNF